MSSTRLGGFDSNFTFRVAGIGKLRPLCLMGLFLSVLPTRMTRLLLKMGITEVAVLNLSSVTTMLFPKKVGLSVAEKVIGNNPRCEDCMAKRCGSVQHLFWFRFICGCYYGKPRNHSQSVLPWLWWNCQHSVLGMWWKRLSLNLIETDCCNGYTA